MKFELANSIITSDESSPQILVSSFGMWDYMQMRDAIMGKKQNSLIERLAAAEQIMKGAKNV